MKLKLRKQKKKKKKKKKTLKENNLIDNNVCKKKRVGRPKKRGPKKKRIRRKLIKIHKEQPVFDFKIVTVLNGKQNGYIGQYHTYSDAFDKIEVLLNEDKKIVFPRKFLNNGNISLSKDEYLVLEKNRYGDKTDGLVRNEFGKFIEQKIKNSTKWVIRDKFVRQVEETFWVYGYDPKTDRKTYTWIYDNLILGKIENGFDIIRILVYKNKLVIKYDDKPMTMVMCKNQSDSIRMYNMISESVRKNRNKQITCIGSYNSISHSRREIEKSIMELTGWNKMKIQRSTN